MLSVKLIIKDKERLLASVLKVNSNQEKKLTLTESNRLNDCIFRNANELRIKGRLHQRHLTLRAT